MLPDQIGAPTLVVYLVKGFFLCGGWAKNYNIDYSKVISRCLCKSFFFYSDAQDKKELIFSLTPCLWLNQIGVPTLVAYVVTGFFVGGTSKEDKKVL